MISAVRTLFALSWLAVAVPVCGQDAVQAAVDPDVAGTVTRLLGGAQHPALKWSAIGDVSSELWALYGAEPDRLLWFDGERPLPAIDGAVHTTGDAPVFGLDPADYDAGLLQVQWARVKSGRCTAVERASFDVALSVAAARMIRAVRVGRVDPARVRWGYAAARVSVDVAASLGDARDGHGLGDVLRRLEPGFPHYVRARAALATYRLLAEAGEPPVVPALPTGQRKLVPGQQWDGLVALAARLRAVGDLVGDHDDTSRLYAGALVDAVRRFQTRHGLDADGVVGPGTLAALNVPLGARVRQIELAMERMRWLPDLGREPSLFVNVANFRLWANDPASRPEPLRMKVVVGEALDHQTPLFVEQLEYIVFRPFWNPPMSIIRDEILPRARKDPGYLARNQYEIVAGTSDEAPAVAPTPESLAQVATGRLTLRQRPGPHNALGLAKFIFPNDDSVYMHGTPSRGGFLRARRDLSHGCIRVEDAAALAAWVLRDQPEWTEERIQAAMHGSAPLRVNLRRPIPVVLFYDTVHVSRQGVVYFMSDIYGHDRRLDTELKKAPHR